MNFFLHWLPTLVAAAILLVAAFLLHLSIRRDERRDSAPSPRGGGRTSAQ